MKNLTPWQAQPAQQGSNGGHRSPEEAHRQATRWRRNPDHTEHSEQITSCPRRGQLGPSMVTVHITGHVPKERVCGSVGARFGNIPLREDHGRAKEESIDERTRFESSRRSRRQRQTACRRREKRQGPEQDLPEIRNAVVGGQRSAPADSRNTMLKRCSASIVERSPTSTSFVRR